MILALRLVVQLLKHKTIDTIYKLGLGNNTNDIKMHHKNHNNIQKEASRQPDGCGII